MIAAKKGGTIFKGTPLVITAHGLQGKQSVRATFRLPDHVIKLLGVAAAMLGLKQKSLFDQLVENQEVLTHVAESAHDMQYGQEKRRQKTYVLSRRSLEVLDIVARQQNIPRDQLVEVSIQRLLPVMNAELEKHRKRALIHSEMQSYLAQGKNLLQKAGKFLGREDVSYLLLQEIVHVCEQSVRELQDIIDKGQTVEDYKQER